MKSGVWYDSNNNQIFIAAIMAYDGLEFGMLYLDAERGRCYLLEEIE